MKKQLIIGFSKSKKKFAIGSLLIRLYQMTPYSHCYIKVQSHAFPTPTIIHASEGKILRMSGTQFDKRHEIVEEFCLELNDTDYKEVTQLMHEISGDDYSIMQNIGIVLLDVARFFGIRMRNPWISGWNCSEFVMEMIKRYYPCKFKNIDPNTVTPKEIYAIMKEITKNEQK